jgi:CRISPR-associated protein Cas2
MNYLITYDIQNNKNRKTISDLLEKYGIRVNYSVFECQLNHTKLNKLIHQIKELDILDTKADSLRFYHIHQNSIPKSFELCKKPNPFEPLELFF